jgi:hypothetical protein
MPAKEESPFDRDRYLPQANDITHTNLEDGEVM